MAELRGRLAENFLVAVSEKSFPRGARVDVLAVPVVQRDEIVRTVG